jgi:DNA polymerase I-like protein with 3'-5' exonuclease and polymerase domains
MLLLRRDVQKVYRVLHREAGRVDFDLLLSPSPAFVLEAARGQPVVYMDTEFDPATKQVYLCGLTFDGKNILSLPWSPEYAEVVDVILRDEKIKKCFHNITADAEALRLSGCTVINGDWFDTMLGMHTLHPALDVGLDDTARYYIDDIQPWKDMDHADPWYNARDVAYGWACMTKQLEEATARPVDLMDELHARMALVKTTYAMQVRGMPVDRAIQKRLRDEAKAKVALLRQKIDDRVRPRWDAKLRHALEHVIEVEERYQALRALHRGTCLQHPTFNGLRKPAAACETCNDLHDRTMQLRLRYGMAKKVRAKARNDVKKWESGFQAHNNDHLRWLLYDPVDGFKLPVQKDQNTKRPTANRTAIDTLSTLRAVQLKPEAWAVVMQIKEVQHLEKAISTFIDVPLDDKGIAHPPYKVHGTRTGRLASGKDSDAKSDNRLAFNALNIPREWRRMYVAPAGHVLVAADWRNVEGRLTAYFSRDAAYTRALERELTGGPKIHAVNAAIIYGIEPSQAKKHSVLLSGQQRTAYDGGKRLTHAWSYGMQPPKMSKTFNITLTEAGLIDEKLSLAYPQLVQWRTQLVNDVLGVWERKGDRSACIQQGRRLLANPFGWQMHFLGVEAKQANEVIAFLPQSTGAGMWTRCAPILESRFPVYTGTYDSFVLVVRAEPTEVRQAIEYLKATMERPWPELDNKTFPCEVQVGYNLGEQTKDNKYGLKEAA